MKRMRLLIITLMLTAMMVISAFAGQWQQDLQGWKYQHDDGSYAVNCWLWIDGNNDGIAEYYYFDSDGYCVMDSNTPDGSTVNADGAWVINGAVQSKSTGNNNAAVSETVPETTAAVRNEVGSTVYWTPNGGKYHSSPNCSTLKRSKAINSGTRNQAGSRDACKVCH